MVLLARIIKSYATFSVKELLFRYHTTRITKNFFYSYKIQKLKFFIRKKQVFTKFFVKRYIEIHF